MLITEGYIDSSVAADEKEGIFNHKVNLTKKKKRHFEKKDNKRGRSGDSKFEGPPKKKSLVDMAMSKRPACRFYLEGKCAKGSLCQFNHDVEKPKKMEVCKYHLTIRGCEREKCQYMHDFPCKYYHTGAQCYSGDKCKFSHDALTEGSRRALEMRVAAEDIIDMEDPDYNYEHKPREALNKPSLLGSPPKFRPDVKKIPSLFEIEVHPPGQPSKPSPQTTRPSGFYSETNVSPNSGIGANSTSGTSSRSNISITNNTITSSQSGQHLLSNQTSNGGPGLLQTPMRSNIMMNSLTGNNKLNLIMDNQQDMNSQQQRLSSIQFMGHGQMNSQQQQGGNLPPVLNMLGAIIREAAMQKGTVIHNMGTNIGMGLSSICQNINNMAALNMNNMVHSMRQDNINMSPSGSVIQNNTMLKNTGSLPPGNASNVNIGLNMMGKMGPSSTEENMGSDNVDNNNKSIVINQHNEKQKDVDYRINRNFEEIKEESQDLQELNEIRQQIQAEIDEVESHSPNTEDINVQLKDAQPVPEKSEDCHKNEDLRDETTTVDEEAEIEIPSHLPKKQKELFKRIQQQQLLREKESEKRENLKSAEEAETKADIDDWYSSDEDGKSDKKHKLTEDLNKLNKQTPAATSETSLNLDSSNVSSSVQTNAPSAASTFNIMQMINTIRSQGSTSTNTSAPELTKNVGSKLSSFQNSQPQETLFPSSPQQASDSFMKLSNILHLPTLLVDPPVVNAVPVKPLVYAVMKISLDMAKPYTQLPDAVNATNSTFKDDPRVKWHLNYLEQQVPKKSQRQESIDGEKVQKQPDPRIQRELPDPRLAKAAESLSGNKGAVSMASDPSLHSVQTQSIPADPRLARLTSGKLDPRLNRQTFQDVNSFMNNKGGGPLIGVGGPMIGVGGMLDNQMGGQFNLINSQMRGNMQSMGYMGSLENSIGVPTNSSGINSTSIDSSRRIVQYIGTPMNNTRPMGNMSMMQGLGNPVRSAPDLFNRMKGFHETKNGLMDLGNNLIGGHGNILGRGQQNILQNDSKLLGSKINSSSDPRLRGQKSQSKALNTSDPRLKNRGLGPREPQSNTQETDFGGIDPCSVIRNSSQTIGFGNERDFDNGNEFKSFSDKLLGTVEHNQGLKSLMSDTATFGAQDQFRISQTRPNVSPNTDHTCDSTNRLPSVSSVSSNMHYSNDEKTTSKFDYRNDPRFKRVKRFMGQTKLSMEYSSPLSGDDGQVDSDEHSGSRHNSYNSLRSSVQNPDSINIRSPQLSDKLHDFDLLNSPTLIISEPEQDLKVKDLFKTIDPTASPFC